MNPMIDLLLAVAKVLGTLHPHLQPKIDNVEKMIAEFEAHGPAAALAAAGADFKASDKAAAVVEGEDEDENAAKAETNAAADPNAAGATAN